MCATHFRLLEKKELKQMPSRIVFLLIVAAVTFHLSFLETCVVLIGYYGFATLDDWLALRARRKMIDEVIDDELFGWELDPDKSGWETKDNLSRVRLPDKDQVVVTRVGSLLRRIFVARERLSFPLGSS